jgi:hypothetical protein
VREGPVVKLEQTIIIALPVEVVFAYRSCLGHAPSWQRDVLTVEVGLPETVGVGTRAVEHRRGTNGETEAWQLEVTEYEPDAVLRIVSQFGTIRRDERHVFVPDGGDTNCTLTMELTGSALPASTVQKQLVEELIRLKWRIEESEGSLRR